MTDRTATQLTIWTRRSERFGCRTLENVVPLQMQAIFIAFPPHPHPLDPHSSYGLHQPVAEPPLNPHR